MQLEQDDEEENDDGKSPPTDDQSIQSWTIERNDEQADQGNWSEAILFSFSLIMAIFFLYISSITE